MIFEKITDSIYSHTEGKTIGNVGVIVNDEGNYVIDTSMYPVMARDIRIELESIGKGKVVAGLFTHYHFDHTGGAQVFHDVPLYGHEIMAQNFTERYSQEAMEKQMVDHAQKELFEGMELTPPNKVFHSQHYTIGENSDIHMFQTGGHTSGSTLVYYEPEKTMFAGDNLFAGLYPWGGDPTASPYDWKVAMAKIQELKPKIIVPGHGGMQYDLNEVDGHMQYLNTVIEMGENLLRDGVSVDQAADQLAEIDAAEPIREGMVRNTMLHWLHVMGSRI